MENPRAAGSGSAEKKPSAGHSVGGEEAVAGVAETRRDVRVGVELAVDVAQVDLDVGVVVLEASDARGAAEDADEDDLRGTGVLEVRDRVRRAATGGEHRVEDDIGVLRVHGLRHGATAELRLVRVVVTRDAHVTDDRVGQEREERVEHSAPGPHDRNQHGRVEENLTRRGAQNRLDRHRRGRQVHGRGPGEDQTDPVKFPPELVRSGLFVPQPRHRGLDHGVFDKDTRHRTSPSFWVGKPPLA